MLSLIPRQPAETRMQRICFFPLVPPPVVPARRKCPAQIGFVSSPPDDVRQVALSHPCLLLRQVVTPPFGFGPRAVTLYIPKCVQETRLFRGDKKTFGRAPRLGMLARAYRFTGLFEGLLGFNVIRQAELAQSQFRLVNFLRRHPALRCDLDLQGQFQPFADGELR